MESENSKRLFWGSYKHQTFDILCIHMAFYNCRAAPSWSALSPTGCGRQEERGLLFLFHRVWDGEPVAAIRPLGLRASSSASSSNWPLILLLQNPTPSQSLSLPSGWGWPTGAHHSFSRPQGWHGTWARPMTMLFYPVLGVELLRKRHFPLVNSIWKWNQYRGEQDDERPFSVTCTWI